jgi:hypothetical protein
MILRLNTLHENARSALECGSSSYRLLMFPSLGVRKPSRFLLYALRWRVRPGLLGLESSRTDRLEWADQSSRSAITL